MSDTQQLALSIQPVISYPRQAQVGKTYLMTIDLQSSEDEWPYEEEEYPIYCMLDTSPLFSYQPLGEPAVVLHRFGGSYGAAEFLLTAAQEEMQGEITVTLANGWGMPIRVLNFDQISITQGITDSQKTTKSYERETFIFQEWGRNPYIVGRPIYEPSKFFGRENIFRFIEDNLSQGVKVILLYGQRRIGKSSLLRQVSNFITSNEFIFVQFDLQDKSQSSLSNIIHSLAIEITEQLNIDRDELQTPTTTQLEENINLFSEVFLPNVYKEIPDKKIVLLLEEFDVANNESSDINEQQTFFTYLKELLKEQDKLFIIAAIERYLHDLANLLNLFKDAPIQEIGFLDEISAKEMIVNLAKGILIYQPEAIQEILELSAGHPCFTQVICSALFNEARENNKRNIERADVEFILKKAIETADSFLQGFWQRLTVAERIIMSAVAEAQKIAIEQGRRVPEEPLDLLMRNGINWIEELSPAWERLVENGYLSDNGRKLKVELIRQWLLQYHSLQYEVKSFQTQESQTELFVAEQSLPTQDFSKSLELYKELFQADSQSYKKGYLNTLSEYAHHLMIAGDYTSAKEQYQKILEIQPNTKSAKQKILEIETYQKTVIKNEVSSNQGWFSKAVAFIRRIIEG